MQIGVLGPLEVVSDAERIPLGGPKQRLVLGLLAAWRGRVVTLDELIDGLWPEGPQDRPRKTVQVYVTRLRRALGDHAEAIRSEAAGYVLDSQRLPVDADAFDDALGTAAGERDDKAAVAVLRRALDLWRGDAFADLRDSPAVVPSAVRLDELRIGAWYDLFDREIRLNPRAVIAEIEAAVEAHPLHEGFASQLMTAEYRVGRQADALATYQQLRRRLREELGLEPGRAVRELEGKILRHELEVVARSEPARPERQRRLVSVLVAELSVRADDDGVIDPEDELAVAAPVRRAARARIRDGGGVLLAEHGGTLTACFGYPSSERSVERAVLAALAVRDLAQGVDDRLEARVGVDTGVVVVESPVAGAHGAASELTGIAGEPLRAAARLAQSDLPGAVLIGPATAAAVKERFDLALPSTSPPVAGSMAVLGAVTAPADASRLLIGRDSARRELAEIAHAATDRLCPVAVAGPAGVGKSVLVNELLADLDPSWPVVRLFCDARHQVTPLHPLRSLLPELFGGETDPNTRTVFAALAARWSGSTPVFVVEDVHAADPSTRELLDELPQRLAVGLLVLTTRDAGPVELGGELVPSIVLGPLDRSTARRLAADLAGPDRLRLETLNEIADRSGGIPLHVVALTRAVLDATPTSAPAAVPTSLYDSLMSGLDQLGPARSFAQRCAVLGESFRADDLVLVGAESDTEAGDHLARMVRSGVLADDGGGRFRFTHALIADTAYESLLNADRAALHARIAAGLPPDIARAEPERLAFHLEMAGNTFQAAVEWRRASASSVRRARFPEAQHHARQALQLLDRLDEEPDGGDTRRRALTNLAIGLQATSHGSDELLEVIAAARASGVGEDDRGRKLILDVIDVSNRQALGDFAGAADAALQSLAAADDAGDELWVAFARQFLGATLVWRGELAAGVEELELAGQYWDNSERPSVVAARPLGALWALLGLAAHFADRAADADVLLQRARQTIPDDDGFGRCLVIATAAVADQLHDRIDAVRREVEPVWSLAMDVGSDFWLGWAQVLLGWSIAAGGERTGVEMMAEAIDGATTRQAVPYFCYLLGSRTCALGRLDEGLARLDDGLATAAATGEELWVPLLHLERARWLDATGAPGATNAATTAAEAAGATAAAVGATLVSRRVAEWQRERGRS